MFPYHLRFFPSSWQLQCRYKILSKTKVLKTSSENCSLGLDVFRRSLILKNSLDLEMVMFLVSNRCKAWPCWLYTNNIDTINFFVNLIAYNFLSQFWNICLIQDQEEIPGSIVSNNRRFFLKTVLKNLLKSAEIQARY